jgi:malate dehydrogenase
MYPDLSHATINGQKMFDMIDHYWRKNEFTPRVRRRWAEIQEHRGWTSVESAAHAAVVHMRDWVHGTNGEWVSMAIVSNGEFGITKGLVYSYPVTCEDGTWKIVEGLSIDAEARENMTISQNELEHERDVISKWLK